MVSTTPPSNPSSPEQTRKEPVAEVSEPLPEVQAVATSASEAKELFEVFKVIDGDTMQVIVEGKSQTVRLIGIDTPESVDPRKPVQCFASEASKKAKEILTGKKVWLEADPTQGDKDKYNRYLRYVFLEDNTNVAKMMIFEGYGHQYTYDKPYKYMEEYKQAEIEARVAKRGLWADEACSVTAKPTVVTTTPTNSGTGYTCGSKTKCGEMSTCDEARYYLDTCGVSRLDGDDDGTPCESLCN